jgi:hypothetical protein
VVFHFRVRADGNFPSGFNKERTSIGMKDRVLSNRAIVFKTNQNALLSNTRILWQTQFG